MAPLVTAGLVALLAATVMLGVFWIFDLYPFLLFLGIVVAYAVSSAPPAAQATRSSPHGE